MKFIKQTVAILIIVLFTNSCKISYSFTGASIPEGTKTFQVNFFQNNSILIEPGIDNEFTNALRDKIRDLTTLDLVTSNGDLVYEGEITEYRIEPTNATSDNRAAQNRLNIRVNVRFYSKTDPDLDFEKPFTFFYDFEGSASLSNAVKATAHEEIFDRITQDIFDASLANW